MKEAVDFVKGALPTSDIVPALTHFLVRDGAITAFNGTMGMSAKIQTDLEVSPHGSLFVKAIKNCKDKISLTLAGGLLKVASAKFSVLVPTQPPDSYPHLFVSGDKIAIADGLLDVLRKLRPFVSDDHSREWGCAILLDGNSAFATNNRLLIEHWNKTPFKKRLCLPVAIIDEMLSCEEQPRSFIVNENFISVSYDSGNWIRHKQIIGEWPNVRAMIQQGAPKQSGADLPIDFFDALKQVVSFANDDKSIYLQKDRISSSMEHEKTGATVGLGELNAPLSHWSGEHLQLLEGIAEKIDFSNYPRAGAFYGKHVRGMIAGRPL